MEGIKQEEKIHNVEILRIVGEDQRIVTTIKNIKNNWIDQQPGACWNNQQ